MTAKIKAEITTAYSIVRDLIAGRCTRRQAEYRLSAFANADEIGRIMAAYDRDASLARSAKYYTPITEEEIAAAYLGR